MLLRRPAWSSSYHFMAPQLSRLARPGLRLQPRDVALLRLVFNYRFVRSDHLQQLIIPRVSRRIIQTRLQKISAHGYLKRLYVPVIIDGEHAPPIHSRQPIYMLTRHGARLLAEQPGETMTAELHAWGSERPSPMTLLHHLVVTDLLVALADACRERADVELLSSDHEGILWQRLRAYRRQHRIVNALVPDGAFTLQYRGNGERLTFYLEVVRADVKGGNRLLLEKFKRYVELQRQGFFRDVYGHERLRAVLILTTSAVRARHFARLAAKLTHGRRLFWFGSFQEAASDGRIKSNLQSQSLLSRPWMTAENAPQVSLASPA